MVIPADYQGRQCRGRDRKDLESRWEKTGANTGGASQTTEAAPRPQWVDIYDEEKEENEQREIHEIVEKDARERRMLRETSCRTVCRVRLQI